MRRPRDWKRLAARRLAIDGHRCVRCGAPCPHPRHHEVNHIVPLRWERDPERARDMANLETLCERCHLTIGAGRKL